MDPVSSIQTMTAQEKQQEKQQIQMEVQQISQYGQNAIAQEVYDLQQMGPNADPDAPPPTPSTTTPQPQNLGPLAGDGSGSTAVSDAKQALMVSGEIQA